MTKDKYLNNKCRTCLNGTKGFQLLTKMITENKDTKSFGQFLKDITHIDVGIEICKLCSKYILNSVKKKIMDETYGEMPQSICGYCVRKVKAAYAFVQQAQDTHHNLWSMLNEVDQADESKTTDCLQESQIDIQNCLEIKVEEDECGQINPADSAEFEIEKLKDYNICISEAKNKSQVKLRKQDVEYNLNDVLDSTNVKQNESISECEDNYNTIDICEQDLYKSEELTGSDGESMSSNDSDWMKDTDSDKARENKIKGRTKKVKETIIDDNIPTPCDQCDRVFPNARLLGRHKRHTHVPEELKVQCPYCAAKFGRRHNMYAHMRTHHKDKPIEEHITQQRKFPRQYACEQCGGTYTSKYYLLAHIKLKHNPDSLPRKPERVILPKKRFLCTLCGSKFDTQSNLDVHIRRHTGEKPYKCDLCERAFYRPCDVQAHRRSHTGEKPFICKICEKAFARSNKLKIHMRTHSNERPYKCDQCEKAFKHSKDLNIHKRIHTGERPYSCGVCHSTFTQSNSLKLHQTKQQHFETIDQVVSC